jgi:hypothetical protein
MGDKAKGRHTGKTQKKRTTSKVGKHGLRPHEQREREEVAGAEIRLIRRWLGY